MDTQIFNKVDGEENDGFHPQSEEDIPVPTADVINSDPMIEEADINSDRSSAKSKKVKKKSKGPSGFIVGLYDWVSAFLFALVLVILIMTFCFRMVDVDGKSMMNTLQDNDKVFITGLNYEPQVGDIVVISHGVELNKTLVKRVIAVGGQTVDIDETTGEVIVDGVVLDEPYILGETMPTGDVEFPVTVTEGTVFVLGDNRPISQDSRYSDVGLIDINNIIGKVQLRVFPFNQFGFVE